jgi:putative endonuclease
MDEKLPVVYILASKRNGYLYIGVTSDLSKRVTQHKEDQADGFSKKYHTHLLVWYKVCGSMTEAIAEEKRMKEWNRLWKIREIEKMNPYWRDLSADL